MSGRVIAVANMKGGVGKTTSVLMLAEGFAASGRRVLVIDLDAQANASYCLAPDQELKAILDARRSVTSFLADSMLFDERPTVTDYVTAGVSKVTKAGEPLPIDLMASGPKLRLLEREILLRLAERRMGIRALEGRALKVLDRAIGALRGSYDIILLDCAPGISAFTEVAIRISDMVLVPTIPDFLSTLGLDAFRASIWENVHVAKSTLPMPKGPPNVLATRVRLSKRQHQEVLGIMREEAAESDPLFRLFHMVVNDSAFIERATDPEQFAEPPTFERKWGEAVSVVRGLVDETRRRLDA